jgi:hypothetical protein
MRVRAFDPLDEGSDAVRALLGRDAGRVEQRAELAGG